MRARLIAIVIGALTVASTTIPADAQSSTSPATTRLTIDGNTGDLVPGLAAAAPVFHMDFLLDDARRLSEATLGTTRDLEISLTSPNNSVFRFMFSPRAQFGFGYDPVSGASRGYAGLTWDLFTENSIYGRLGLASSFDAGGLGGGLPERRMQIAPVTFHGAIELGYRFDQKNSVSLAIDQGVVPIARGNNPETVDNFVLRFGRKF